MSIVTMISLILPATFKALGWTWDRINQHGVSSLQGTVLGAGVFTALQTMHCDLSLLGKAAIAVAASLSGLLGTDAGKTAQTFLEAIQEAIPKEMAPATAPIASWLPLLLVGALVSGCSAAQVQKTQTVILQLKADEKQVVVMGCADLPVIELLAGTALSLAPAGSTTAGLKLGATIAEPQVEAFCAKVKALADAQATTAGATPVPVPVATP